MATETMETTVYISSRMDFKTRFKNWWKKLRLRTAFQHIGLLITLMGYTVAGGLVFRRFEYPNEIARLNFFNSTLVSRRKNLIEQIVNNSDLTNFDYFISSELKIYEDVLQDAFSAGIPVKALNFSVVKGIPISPPEKLVKWNTLKAVFFSSTVLTTIVIELGRMNVVKLLIGKECSLGKVHFSNCNKTDKGYGDIVPETTEGRAFCIVFALIGIPLTLTVIADWGRLFASTVSTLVKYIPPLPKKFRNAMVARRTSSYALSAVCFLFVYLAAGAGLFVIWEEDWSFFDGFYFCFITMTTIGFGDLVPKKPNYMLICTLYILVGLALTSTIIELVRRQYAQSWRQLRALRGPLAENFRKFADNAPGLDVMAFQQDLMKVLTVVTMPKKSLKREKKLKQKEWEDAIQAVIRDITVGTAAATRKPPMVQIVIYESSV